MGKNTRSQCIELLEDHMDEVDQKTDEENNQPNNDVIKKENKKLLVDCCIQAGPPAFRMVRFKQELKR